MADKRRSNCPISCSLDIFGDKWTLIIIRDLITGKKRFNEFLESPERITTSVLTARLNQLEATGLVVKKPYQMRPTRYEHTLSQMGFELVPVLQEMCRWGNKHLKDTWVAPEDFMNLKP